MDEFYTLVSLPANVEYINEYITVLTGIKKDDLDGCPSFCEAFSKFLKWSKDCKYIYCWGTADIRSIYYTIYREKKKGKDIDELKRLTQMKFIDLKNYISKIDPSTRHMGLMEIYEKNIQVGDKRRHHTPVYDSKLEMKVHQYYLNEAKKINFDFEHKNRAVKQDAR